MFPTLSWDTQKKALKLIDQRLLPHQVVYRKYYRACQVAKAIKDMVVRGAPAIGIVGAFGLALEADWLAARAKEQTSFWNEAQKAYQTLIEARPTAVNLSWALKRLWVKTTKEMHIKDVAALWEQEALQMIKEDVSINKMIGQNGADLLKLNSRVLTHCNAGALATAGWGTALGVIRSAQQEGKIDMVYANETRPYLQGARLTAFELLNDNIPVTLIADNTGGYLMQQKSIDAVIVGADRIAANGDTANKIGTCSLATLAYHHRIPFYVAAPISTIDLNTETGKKIVIEERNPQEITHLGNKWIAPKNIKVYNPSFDITPASLITGVITEKGVISYPQTPLNYLQESMEQ